MDKLAEAFGRIPKDCTYLVCNHERAPEVTAILYRRVDLKAGLVDQYVGKGDDLPTALWRAIAEAEKAPIPLTQNQSDSLK